MLKNNNDVDKHKVFVYNIKAIDVPLLRKEFENICNKHFFISNKNVKSAICHFKSKKEAEDFILKYNGVKVFNSNIKCEFALKKKCEQKKLISIIYNRQKIKFVNSVQININYDLDCIVILDFLKNVFLMNRGSILSCLDKVKVEKNENKDFNEHEDSANSIEIVPVDKKLKDFEELVINIKKENKSNNKKKEQIKSHLKNNKEINNHFIYTIEFLNIKLASVFFKYINKNSFENYLKEKLYDVKDNFLFSHELCFSKINNKRVVLKNLSRKCHTENIKKLFKHIDENIKVFFPKKNNKKQGCAFVYFSTYKSAQKALLLNKSKLCGNIISIEKLNNNLNFLDNSNDNNECTNLKIKENRSKSDEKYYNDDDENESEDNENEDNENEDNENEDNENEDNENEDNENEDNENEDNESEDNENEDNENEDNESDEEENAEYSSKNRSKPMNDVDEGKTLFITNIPSDTTSEEIKNYIENNISRDYIYIKTCRNNTKRISVFVKLKSKKDADNFLKKIGEYEEEEEEEHNAEENVIDKFYRMEKKKKKEKMKKILLKDGCNNANSEFLFFKNNYLMIKRAVRKDIIKDKKKFTIEKKKEKKKLDNNIHLLYDNNINNENLGENIIKRNNKLMEKKKELLKNRNFLINPCRIYIRNYPAMLEQNIFRQLITKYFTPIIMKKYNIKKKEAFKKSNEIITKMKVVKENVNKDKKIENEKIRNNKNIICFIDIDKHENAKMLINLLQNKNIYELINEIVYKQKFQTIRKNKNIMYVDYCIEDVRMLHIKKLKTEKFLNYLKEKNIDINTKKTIKKKKRKTSRGKRQREKRRLLKMQEEQANISNVLQNKFVNEQTQKKISKKMNNNNNSDEINNKGKYYSRKKNNNENKRSNEIANNKKNIKPKKNDNLRKLIKKKTKQKNTKKSNNETKSIQKDVLKFLKNFKT